MHKASSNRSSSAPAMVDSDSAEVAASDNSKLAGGSIAAPLTNVKLLIKASNQQFDDQTIECDFLWSVKRVKKQLSLVYPCKPAISEQKLIYSGQLLNDTQLLKDVIRSYKDVHTQNHIFHLVCASKYLHSSAAKKIPMVTGAAMATNPSSTSTVFSADGIRYRNNANSTTATTQQQQQQSNNFNTQFIPQMLAAGTPANIASICPNFDPNNAPNMLPFSFAGQFNMHSLATQQAAMYSWMQQVYSQYMDQCIRFSNHSATGLPHAINTPDEGHMPHLNGAYSPFAANNFLQHMPFMPNGVPAANFSAFANPGTAPPVILFQNPATPEAAVAATNASIPQAAPAAAVEQPPAAARVAGGVDRQAPRLANAAHGQDHEHHDWLDNFFSLTRLAIFLMILVFNTSTWRCLLVLIIAGGIYLYHIGYLRIRSERNNNNINRNNNAADAANQIRQGVQDVQQAQAQQQQEQQPPAQGPRQGIPPAAELAGGSSTPQPTAASGDGTDTPSSVISFLRTFVLTFFTSLLPDTPTQ